MTALTRTWAAVRLAHAIQVSGCDQIKWANGYQNDDFWWAKGFMVTSVGQRQEHGNIGSWKDEEHSTSFIVRSPSICISFWGSKVTFPVKHLLVIFFPCLCRRFTGSRLSSGLGYPKTFSWFSIRNSDSIF